MGFFKKIFHQPTEEEIEKEMKLLDKQMQYQKKLEALTKKKQQLTKSRQATNAFSGIGDFLANAYEYNMSGGMIPTKRKKR